jgi:very-short-patch-repair endonuclease
VEEEDLFAAVATAALARLHFDPDTLEDQNEKCHAACYECVLSYSNQGDHRILNRHMVTDLLRDLTEASATRRHGGRDYDAHYEYLKNLTDSRSELERKFIAHLYRDRRDLPDAAQRALVDAPTVPDFYYSGSHACIYCDGSVHDTLEQKAKDDVLRRELREKGYRAIVIRYDSNLAEQIALHPEVFGLGKK